MSRRWLAALLLGLIATQSVAADLIERIVVKEVGGTPVFVSDVAQVLIDHAVRDLVGRALERAAARAGVTASLDRVIGNLSRGHRQRAGIAQALLGDPDLRARAQVRQPAK